MTHWSSSGWSYHNSTRLETLFILNMMTKMMMMMMMMQDLRWSGVYDLVETRNYALYLLALEIPDSSVRLIVRLR